MWSLDKSISMEKAQLMNRLRKLVPDLSDQESSEKEHFNAYWELKRRSLQAFQCDLMLKLIDKINRDDLRIVDIGDSAGTHMMYLKELAKQTHNIDTISVNLDPRAIAKIKARGLKAIHCRAEDLELDGKHVDAFTSFQMVEHLHNPAIFFRRLAKKTSTDHFLMTVPYMKTSRVGLHQIRYGTTKNYFAEDEHIFELSPEDWKLLLLHSGWKVVYSEIYYQYPKRIPFIGMALSRFWRSTDYEGFLGVFLEKDTTVSDRYQDWEE